MFSLNAYIPSDTIYDKVLLHITEYSRDPVLFNDHKVKLCIILAQI